MGDAYPHPHLLPQHSTVGKLCAIRSQRQGRQRRFARFSQSNDEMAPHLTIWRRSCAPRRTALETFLEVVYDRFWTIRMDECSFTGTHCILYQTLHDYQLDPVARADSDTIVHFRHPSAPLFNDE